MLLKTGNDKKMRLNKAREVGRHSVRTRVKPLEGSWEAPVRQPMVKGLHQMGLYFRDSGVRVILSETGSRVFQDGLTLVV